MTRRHSALMGALVTLFALALVAGAVVGVVRMLDATHPVSVRDRCLAEMDGTPWALETDQADNAALIAAMTLRRDLPARAATIGLATALQESKLRNIDYGDRDSLGIFQQRPSQGWGTPEQIQDPVYATSVFFDHLVQVPGWQEMPITEAAQAVQRSAYPDAYANHEHRSRAWASGLTGHSTAVVTCALNEPDSLGSVEDFVARVARDLGDLPTTSEVGVVVIDAAALGPADEADRLAWAVGQWAVAVAASQHITSVQVGDQLWTRQGTWQTTTNQRLAVGAVRVTLATDT